MANTLNTGQDISVEAGADLSGDQFKLIALNDKLVAGVADVALPLQNAPGLGEAAALRAGGQSKVEAGAAIADGAQIAPDANGRARTAVSGDFPVGTALEAAAGLNSIITVLITPTLTPLA